MSASENIHDLLNYFNVELENVSTWFKSNRLILNLNKCNYIIFTRKGLLPQDLPEVKLNGTVISRLNEAKFLGIVLDSKLNFRPHISYLVNKLSKYGIIFYKLRKILPINCMIKIYISLVYPNLLYSISAWGATCDTILKPLQVLQNRILRNICGLNRRASTVPVFREHRLLNIRAIYCYITASYIYKDLNGINFHNFCHRRVSGMLTRSDDSNFLILHSTNILNSRQSVRYHGVELFNALPLCIRNSNSLNSFKLSLKRHLLAGAG